MPDTPDSSWAFDFARWTLEDIIAYEESATLRQRLPVMAKAILRTPYPVDLTDRTTWTQISAHQWKEIARRFADALAAAFQGA